MIRVVLVEPEIPQNTGNIARTCVCTGTPLIIAGPMGFTITEARVRRAGLDYWPELDLTILERFEDLFEAFPDGRFWYFSSKARIVFSEVAYEPDCFLIFGKETQGLPKELIERCCDRAVRIPLVSTARCLNLSNAVCTGLYEALRQNGYPGLYMPGGTDV